MVVTSDASTIARTSRPLPRRPRRRARGGCPRGGKVAAQDVAVRALDDRARWSRSPTPTRAGSRRRCAGSSVRSRTPRSATCGAGWPCSARAGRTGRAPTGASRLAPGPRVGGRLDHRRQRLDLRGPRRRLRGGRPPLGARPLVPVPDRPAGRRAVYAAAPSRPRNDHRHRGESRRKVRMFGHCWLLVARGRMSASAAWASTTGSSRLPPPAALRQRGAAPRAARPPRSCWRWPRAASTRGCSARR